MAPAPSPRNPKRLTFWGVRRAWPFVLLAVIAAPLVALGQARLVTGGDRAGFGVHARTGMSDTLQLLVVSGGSYDVRTLDTAPSCRGNVMLEPDLILRLTDPPPTLRLGVEAAGDTTLVVHTPDGRWLCDDDSGSSTNPRLVITGPLEGQYDVWVGSYRPEQNLRARVTVE